MTDGMPTVCEKPLKELADGVIEAPAEDVVPLIVTVFTRRYLPVVPASFQGYILTYNVCPACTVTFGVADTLGLEGAVEDNGEGVAT